MSKLMLLIVLLLVLAAVLADAAPNPGSLIIAFHFHTEPGSLIIA